MKKLLIFLILLIGLSSISTGFVWDDQQPVPTETPSSYVWDNTTTVPTLVTTAVVSTTSDPSRPTPAPVTIVRATPVPVTVVTSTPVSISTIISNTTSKLPIEFSLTNIIVLIGVILIIIVVFIELKLRQMR